MTPRELPFYFELRIDMNKIKSFTLLFILFFFNMLAFAEVNCPQTDMIMNLQFLKADGVQGIWDLYSNNFDYSNRNWQVIFTVYLPDAKNMEQAIQLGTDFYRYQVMFFDHPLGSDQDNRQVCYYAQQESTYFVRAISEHAK